MEMTRLPLSLLLLLGGACTATTSNGGDPPACTSGVDCPTDLAAPADLATPSVDLAGVDMPRPIGSTLSADWSRRAGSNAVDYGASIAIDKGGDVIVAGQAGKAFDLDGVTVAMAPFVAKLDRATGAANTRWVKALPTTIRTNFYTRKKIFAVTTDRNGDVLVAGSFNGSVTGTCADGSKLNAVGVYDVFVMKLKGSDGACLWSRNIHSNYMFPFAITTNSKNDVLVAGNFSATATFNGMSFASVGLDDIFVAQYDALGAPVKFKRFGSNGNDGATAIAVDAGDRPVIAGYFSKGLSIGSSVLNHVGGLDLFVARLGTDLEPPMAEAPLAVGGSGNEIPQGVAVGPDGDVAVAGSFQATVDFSPDRPGRDVIQSADQDGFLAVLDPTLKTRWVRGFGGNTTADVGTAVAFDSARHVLLAGVAKGIADLGEGPVTTQDQDAFLSRFDVADGGKGLVFLLGAEAQEEVWGMAVGPGDDVAVVGMSNSTQLKLGDKTWPGSGDFDLFIARWISNLIFS